MADYTSQHSGSNIDKGVQIALDWDPTVIGCKRVSSTLSEPLDLNTFLRAGSWVVDYYVNGPTNLLNHTPLPFTVTETFSNSTLTLVTQTVNVDSVKCYRNYNVQTRTWSEWVENGEKKIIVSTGTSENIAIVDSTVLLVDLAEFTIKLNETLYEGATITINGKGPYELLMPDNNPNPGGIFCAGSFIKVIFSGTRRAFYMIATPVPNELLQTLMDYGARIQGLESDLQVGITNLTKSVDNISGPMADRIVKALEDLNNPGAGGFAHSVGHGAVETEHAWTKITFNNEGVIERGEHATAADILMDASNTKDTLAKKLQALDAVVPDKSALSGGRVVATDSNGKLTTTNAPTLVNLNKMVIISDKGEDASALPS